MQLTFDQITDLLVPLHRVLSRSAERDVRIAGMTLQNFTDGAGTFSVQLIREVQLRCDQAPVEHRSQLLEAILTSYDIALENFTGDVIRFTQRVAEVSSHTDPNTHALCLTTIERLSALISGKGRSAPRAPDDRFGLT